MEIGKHCAVQNCNQLDFLPFECSECKKSFCQEHRYQTEHACEKLHQGKKEIDIHHNQKVNKCPVKGCKNVLSIVNEFVCETCKTKVCLTHRFEESHECKKPIKAKEQQKPNGQQKPLVEIQNKQQEKPKKTSFFMCCFRGKPNVEKKKHKNNKEQIAEPQKNVQKK